MNLWKSLFIAEVRRSRLAFAVFLSLKATFCAAGLIQFRRLGSGQLSDPDGAFPWFVLSTIIPCLIGFHVFRGSWQDSPTRTTSHLAFRPLRHRWVASAQLSAWFLLFILPSAAAEGFMVHGFGLANRIILLGVIQSLFGTGLVILAAFWAGWMWDSPRRIAVGAILLISALIHAAYFLGTTNSPWIRNVTDLDVPILFITVWAFIIVLLGFLLLFVRSRRPIDGWTRVIASPALVYAALFLTVLLGNSLTKLVPRSPSDSFSGQTEELPSPSIVAADRSSDSAGGTASILSLRPPAPASLLPDENIEWAFTSLSAGDAPIAGHPPSRTLIDGLFDLAAYNALSRHLGEKIILNSSIHSQREEPARTVLPADISRADLRNFNCKLGGTITRWVVSGDRTLHPFEAGGAVLLDPRYRIWLSPEKDRDPYKFHFQLHFLYSPASGRLVELSPRQRIRLAGFDAQVAMPDYRAAHGQRYDGSRLISLRMETRGRVRSSWKAEEFLSPPVRSQPDSAGDPWDTGIITKWLAEHPAPPRGAASVAVSGWLHDFLPRLEAGQDRNSIPGLKDTMQSVAENHPRELLDAMISGKGTYIGASFAIVEWLPKSLLRETIVRSIPRGRFPEEERGGYAMDTGLTALLAPYAAEQARRGECRPVLEILLSVPEAVGLTHAEWLDVFRLHPSARCYEALQRAGVPRDELNKETDLLLKIRFPLARKGNSEPEASLTGEYAVQASAGEETWQDISDGSVPDVELALARGHPQAVQWYARCYQSLASGRVIHIPSFETVGSTVFSAAESLGRYFVIPGDISSEDKSGWIRWFRSQKPEDFTFDPKMRKFRLK